MVQTGPPVLPSYLHKRLSQVGSLLNELAVFFEEGAEEEAQVLDEVLLVVLSVGVGQPDVSVQRQHLNRPRNISSQSSLYLFIQTSFCLSGFSIVTSIVFCFEKIAFTVQRFSLKPLNHETTQDL